MLHLKYYAYEGVGVRNREKYLYSQARLGGWHEDGKFETEINAQIDLALSNVEKTLKDAGGKGWSQVFRVNSYHVPINDEAMGAMVRNFAKHMPDHQPLWTCVGVTRLGADDMRVEIEVVAHDPEGAKKA
ncbi:hypothetical protein ACHAQH_004508 [Verticillium albo-atrum]